MQIFKFTNKYTLLILFPFLSTSCITTSQKEALQMEINELEAITDQLQERFNTQLKQVERTTRATLASQSDLQNFQTQLEENAGEVDVLKSRVKKMEELAAVHESINATNAQTILQLQRQIARLQVSMPEPSVTPIDPDAATTVLKVKTVKELTKVLKTDFEKGNFKDVIQKATSVITSSDSTPDMIAVALQLRGESKFQLTDYRGAASDLAHFVEKYPQSDKYARGLLLLGDAYVFLENHSVAAGYYKDCIKHYGSTAEGEACEARIAKL